MPKLTKEEYLKKAQDYAKSRGGECLSEEYVSSAKNKLIWYCGVSTHKKWAAAYDHVVNGGSWCVECAKQNRKDLELPRRETYYKKAQEYALSKDGKCLSTEYINMHTGMLWQCNNQHTWKSNYEHVVEKSRWCQKCFYDSSIMKDGYESAMKYAISRGGLVIVPKNTKIKGHTKLTFKCENLSHKTWEGTFTNVVTKNSWCPYCAGRFSKEEYLQKAKNYAISKGGACLSDKYENQNTKLRFKCQEPSHTEWTGEYNSWVLLNRWCKDCKKITQTPKQQEYLEKAKKHAESRGGICLSTKYTTSSTKLLWQCSNKHKPWSATYQNVVGTLQRWCPTCAGQLTPEELRLKVEALVQSRNGIFLGEGDIRMKGVYQWRCQDSTHPTWKSSVSSIINNKSWCPKCGNSTYYKENTTRVILEDLLGFSLEKAREEWNINHLTNHTLELDGYNEINKFAFEFQGRQHFEENIFPGCDLKVIQEKDKIKKQNCIDNNVFLLEIKDEKNIRTPQQFIHYIARLLQSNNIKYNENYDNEVLLKKLDELNRKNYKLEYLKKAQNYAISKGGVCLSKEYTNYKTPLLWSCANEKHIPWRAGISIATGGWCPECAGKKPKPVSLVNN